MSDWFPNGRRQVLALLVLLCFPGFLVPACTAGPPSSASYPNVLLIVADDLGWKDLGCYGSTYYETPHLDRLASQGVRFTNAYSACPVCSPSRAAILTGRSPARIGLTGHINPTGSHRYPPDGPIIPPQDFFYLPNEEITLAEVLRREGYQTACIGKWHLGGESRHMPVKQGFDVMIGYMPGGYRDAPLHHFSYFFPYFDCSRSPDFRIPGLETGASGEYLTDRLTTEAISWLESLDRDRPFFLYLAHYAVHMPLQAPPNLLEKYEKKLQRDTSQKSAAYGAMVENLDSNVGRLLAALDALALTEKTIIIFTSDNGGDSSATNNAPLREGKGYLYEGGIRVPLIIKWPESGPITGVSTTPVIGTDLFPTVLEMTGVSNECLRPLDGESLVPLLSGDGELKREALYWYYPHYSPQAKRPGAAIRWKDLKLIVNYDPPSAELFDLSTDLGERHDLAARRPDQVQLLKEKLSTWLEVVDAKLHTANPHYAGGED